MIETLANGLWNLQSHGQYFKASKSWWIKAVNEETLTEFVRLSGLFCAIIRANLLIFHFIPEKFGANNRVVWLSMVWLSGLCCIYRDQLSQGSMFGEFHSYCYLAILPQFDCSFHATLRISDPCTWLVARIFQARWGRCGKQQQEQNSQNLGNAFRPSPVDVMDPRDSSY